jgi:hypothetical protein
MDRLYKAMHPDDLKKVWLCCECGRSFAFNSDVEDHKRQFRHSKMMLSNVHNDAREMQDELFIRGRTSLEFRLNTEMSRIVIEYEYYPSSGEIIYVDVRYTDSRLRSIVEGNPEMMRNIDNYLRRFLIQKLPVRL